MLQPLELLVVDQVADNRLLLSKALARRFGQGVRTIECEDEASALTAVRSPTIALAIVHRTAELDGLELVGALRRTRPSLPILAMSGHDRRSDVIQAGANAFLHYDGWLSVGRVVEDMLQLPPAETPAPVAPAPNNSRLTAAFAAANAK